MAAAAPTSLVTEPLFFGDVQLKDTTNGIPAEAFISRMDAIRLQSVLTEQIAITRVATNFREEAADWWSSYALSDISGVELNRIQVEWAYFVQIFKRRYFSIRDLNDTVSDISDVTQKSVEVTPTYLIRMSTVLHQSDLINKEFVHEKIDDEMVTEPAYPPALQQCITDLAAHPLTGPQLKTNVDAAMRGFGKQCANYRGRLSHFEQVARTAARNARDPNMRTFIRKIIYTGNRTVPELVEKCRLEERSYKKLPQANTGKISAVEMEEEGVSSTVDDALSSGDEDGFFDDDSRICAIKAGTYNKTRKNFKKQFKKKQPSKAKSDSKAAGNAKKHFLQYKCIYCSLDTHQTKECRKFRKSIGLPADGELTVKNASAPYQGKGGYKKPQQQQQRGAGQQQLMSEPMDTSGVTLAPMRQQPVVQYHQDRYEPQQQQQYDFDADAVSAMTGPPPAPAFYNHWSGN